MQILRCMKKKVKNYQSVFGRIYKARSEEVRYGELIVKSEVLATTPEEILADIRK